MSDRVVCHILGQVFVLESSDPHISALLRAIWGAMESDAPVDAESPATTYRVIKSNADQYTLELPTGAHIECATDGELIYQLEQDLVVSLQTKRSDLAFVHSGVVVRDGRATVLAAASGCGKTTTVWGLLQQGFAYASDELAPIDINRCAVWTYPRGLCFKKSPLLPCLLPETSLTTSYTLHVAVDQLSNVAEAKAYPIGAFMFVDYQPEHSRPEVVALSKGATSVRLYAALLNHLAHANSGLSVVAHLASLVPGYHVRVAELSATAALIADTMAHLPT